MTYSEFSDWKRHPVTQQVFSQLEARANEAMEYLIDVGGKDPIKAEQYATYIKAVRDFLSVEFEGESQ